MATNDLVLSSESCLLWRLQQTVVLNPIFLAFEIAESRTGYDAKV